jgi:hypothetical protein
MDSIVRSKEARSRSSLLITKMRGTATSCAYLNTRSVITCTPATPSTSNSAASATASAPLASATKAAYPGVSRRLTFFPFHSRWARAVCSEILRSISSSSKSVVVVPSSTRPRRVTAPATKSIAEVREVLPESPCPMSATFRMSGVS